MSLETSLLQKINNTTALLHAIATQYPPVTFANSFGAEDMVLTDLICQHVPGIEMFSIDTGRLPEETYRLMQEVKRRYGISIQAYFPNEAAVERYLRAYGPNAFYESIKLRKACCYVRKVEPLRRALAGKRAGICRCRSGTPTTGCRSSIPCSNGRKRTCGTISGGSACPTTPCTTAAIPASVAARARARWRRARISARAAGGGKSHPERSAACTAAIVRRTSPRPAPQADERNSLPWRATDEGAPLRRRRSHRGVVRRR